MAQNAMRLCFAIPKTMPTLVVLAEAKSTESRRILITVPDCTHIDRPSTIG